MQSRSGPIRDWIGTVGCLRSACVYNILIFKYILLRGGDFRLKNEPQYLVIYKKVPTFAVEKYRFLYRDGTFFGISISITTTYLRRGKRAFFPVFSRENRRIRGDIIPAGCYRNLFATCRLKSGIPMSGERPRSSGSNAPARFGSGCGFRPEGEGEAVIRAQTDTWPFLEIGGFLQKNGKYRSKQGCTIRNGQTYAAWRLLNA